MPIYVAFEIRFEDIFRTVFDDKSDGRTTNGVAKTKDLSFHEFGLERFFTFDGSEQKTFDFEIKICVGFFIATDFVVVSEDNT